jgi:hypothetical protein
MREASRPKGAAGTIVVPMLTKMKLPRHVLLDLASKIGGERANVADHEPSNVVGFETWRWGTRMRKRPAGAGLGRQAAGIERAQGI